MPSSLRFILWLSVFSVLLAAGSLAVLHRQDRRQAQVTAEQISGGRVDDGKHAIERYGCGGCHEIDGIGAEGNVGPSLKAFAARTEIAGRLTNQPDQLVLWLRHPQQVIPGNGMPDQGIDERDARDIAAYLYTLRPRL